MFTHMFLLAMPKSGQAGLVLRRGKFLQNVAHIEHTIPI